MFSYYGQWVPKFSDKIRPLVKCKKLPLSQDEIKAFQSLKKEIAGAAIVSIDNEAQFVVETDASDKAIAATLNQQGRPVAFFSRTLSQTEQRHSSVEKEAYAVVEALRKWKHYLIGRHFKLITDQRSISFVFNNQNPGKTKNDKITRWRMELSCFNYDIVYRPGKENLTADALSRTCFTINIDSLKSLHDQLCHPGVSRLSHFVRSRNLPFSVEEIKRVTS